MGVRREQAGVAVGCVLAALLPAAAVLPGSAAGTRDVAAAAFPGDNGLIAFVSDREGGDDLYVMQDDGTAVQPLTATDQDEQAPAWSPDGTHLAFVRDESESTAIFVMDRNGDDEQQLTEFGDNDYAPAWSPDGGTLVFSSDRETGSDAIWTVPSDGSEPPQLLIEPPGDGSVYDPSWSPNGQQIAFSANGAPEGSSFAIWVADADGSNAAQVSDPGLNESHYEPDWSPDGERMAFTSEDEGESHLFSMAADGSDVDQLTAADEEDSDPSWSPDGTAIAFQRTVDAAGTEVDTVWRMAADGSDQEQLSGAGIDDDGEPAWAPVPPVETVVVEPPGDAREVGDDATVEVTATDALGDPAAGRALVVRITGPHPQTRQLTTDDDGRASYTWESTGAGTDTVLVCADPDGDGACDPEEPADTATVLWSVPAADEPRLAFTDDTDALHTIEVDRVRPELSPLFYRSDDEPRSFQNPVTGFARGPTHEGEAAGVPGAPPAFVSTRDDPAGEVYLAQLRTQPYRLTCDPGTETHPVVNSIGQVAYASDADGDWDIYVTSPPPLGRPAPFGRSAVPSPPRSAARALATACDVGWTTVNVTDEPDDALPADDLWPTWTWSTGISQPGTDVDGLAFSRALEGELPDLYRAPITGGGFGPPVPLTTTPEVAETQPAGMAQSRETVGCDPDATSCPRTYRGWLAFTTTEFRPSGTIALLATGSGEVVYPASQRFQGLEPAWSSDVNPTQLAISTTEDDAYGDIAIAEVDPPVATGDSLEVLGDPVVGGFGVVALSESGTAESHPHWLDAFDSGEDDEARLVITSRSTEVAAGGRFLEADVSDVLAVDGTQRRVIRRQRIVEDGEVTFRFDEAGPGYEPHGGRIVYSRETGRPDGILGARLLMVADPDGANAAPLLPAGLREQSDVDLDPVWSPDGTRITFVRLAGRARGEGEPPDPPQVYVYDLDAGTVTRVRAGDGTAIDTSPSWAPDSRHLVLARSTPGCGGTGDPRDAARRWQDSPGGCDAILVVADADRPLDPAIGFDTCDDGCQARGRSPAWSPDGTTIAYDDDGQLLTIALDDACCDAVASDIPTSSPVTLIGAGDDPGTLTPSRAVVESAQDPAWSPDGSEIAFTGQPVGQPDHRGIWRIGVDGADPRVFTDEPGPESEPAWQNRREADVAVTVSIAGSPAMINGPVIATFTVTNLGPRPAPLVSLDTGFAPGAVTNAPGAPAGCRGNGTGCDLPVLAPGESRVYPVRVRHPARVLGTATGTVTADAPDPDLFNNTDSAPYRVMGADVAVEIDLDAPIGYVGGRRVARVTVRNVGVDPVEDVEVQASWPAAVRAFVPALALPPPAAQPAPDCLVQGLACPLGTLGAGGRRAYLVEVRTPTEGPTVLAAEVSTSTMEVDLTNNEDEVALEVLQPELRVLPSVAPPGKVVLAYGERFPPGSRVTLRWRPGITVIRGSFPVAPDGTLRMPLLVVRHDLLGERELVAQSTTALFRAVRADLLVVPRTLSPPSFNGRG